jgi:transposase
MYEYRQVLNRMRLGETDRAVARSGLMGREKARDFRKLARDHGWLDPSNPLPDNATLTQALPVPSSCRPQTSSLVLPHQEQVTVWWRRGIRGKTIHQALVRNHGFTGSYSSIRRFLQQLKAAHPEASTVLDFDPGEVAQVDFGKGVKITDVHTGEVFDTWFFVMVLAFSRHQYAEIVRDQKVATWLGCHRRAFEFFGGVPKRVMIDNPKTAITRACYHDPEMMRAYEECAEGYGFVVSPCPVRDPKKKGRVEAGVKYIKGSFLPLREFRSLPDANQQLRAWILREAGNRIHGSTHERPLARFAETERQFLRPLPPIPPELATWVQVKVHGDCHVQFEKCRYSVPYTLVRKKLWLRATETTVRIYQNEMVGVHARLEKPGSRSTVPEHLPPEGRAYLMRDPQWCLKQSRLVGPACHELIETLFDHDVLDRLRAAQGIIRLKERYGPIRLEAACCRALAYDDPRYRTVKTILDNGLDQQLEIPETNKTLTGAYTGNGRFTRDAKSLFN